MNVLCSLPINFFFIFVKWSNKFLLIK
jgi:hypothetical protein